MRQELCPLQRQETGAGGGWSMNHTLRGTEEPDAQGLMSTLLTGAQDTTGGPRRPQGHAGLWRHPPGLQSLPVTRPRVRIPCTWDASRAAVHGQVNAVWTTRAPTPSSVLEPEPLPGFGLRGRRPWRLASRSRPRVSHSPLLGIAALTTWRPRPAGRHKETRFPKPWRPGSCPRRGIGSLGRAACLNTPRGPLTCTERPGLQHGAQRDPSPLGPQGSTPPGSRGSGGC